MKKIRSYNSCGNCRKYLIPLVIWGKVQKLSFTSDHFTHLKGKYKQREKVPIEQTLAVLKVILKAKV